MTPEGVGQERREMKEFVFIAKEIIKAENEDDARIDLIQKMDEHNICWELEIDDV